MKDIKKGSYRGIGFLSANALYPNALEKTVERYLVKRVKEAGGVAPKWVSPGMSGVPDRIVFLPGGRIIFVEVKAPGKKLRPLQLYVKEQLEALGVDFRVVDSKEAVNALFF
jgi:Holliday junction resolvase